MQNPGPSRKRPGTSPMPSVPASSSAFQYPQIPENAEFNFDFTQPFNTDQVFSDPSALDVSGSAPQFASPQGAGYSGQFAPPLPSTDLVRRARTQQLAPSNISQQETWNGYGPSNGQSGDEDEQELDMKVQMAKRDAQGKRKQIPPFVQKLSSNNTDLIRWSDDGRSFIVLDEDEFARTLIPELFKHNNYASFVRQLNMYGFHKTVNITDGSLRQSEKARKGVKPPSMYSHPYFRKNRPDLLWLIQKPNGKSSTKRKRDGTAKDDSDDERQFSPAPEGRPHELGQMPPTSDLTTLPKPELAAVRTELQKLQTQQRFISKMIAQLKEQNEQFYRQASAFQALHDRHENSINAILTFLATFYNRSLDGSGAQNLVNMFNSQNQNNQQQGGVVEEFNETQADTGQQVQRYVRRPQLLLEGPAAVTESLSPRDPTTVPGSNRTSTSPPAHRGRSHTSHVSATPQQEQATASPAIKSDAPTPDVLQSVPENDAMMNIINSVNATHASAPSTVAPSVEFNSALNNYQNAAGNSPLTPQQRNDMLALMANRHGDGSKNNALIAPQPPAMPDLNQLKQTQQQLEMLTNMQKRQDERVQELNRRLQPLSPTGSIPGLAGGDENPFDITGGPGDFDPNTFVNFDDWGAGNGDLNFDFANADDNADLDWDFGNPGPDSGADMFTTTQHETTGADRGNPASSEQPADGRVSSIGSADVASADVASDVGLGPTHEDDSHHDDDHDETPNKRARNS